MNIVEQFLAFILYFCIFGKVVLARLCPSSFAVFRQLYFYCARSHVWCYEHHFPRKTKPFPNIWSSTRESFFTSSRTVRCTSVILTQLHFLLQKKTYSQPRFLRTGYLGLIFSWFSYVFFYQNLAFHRNSVGVPTKTQKPIGLSLLFDIWVFLKKT